MCDGICWNSTLVGYQMPRSALLPCTHRVTHAHPQSTDYKRHLNDLGIVTHNNMQPTLFGGNMYIFSGRMTTTRASTGGVATYPYAQGTDLA